MKTTTSWRELAVTNESNENIGTLAEVLARQDSSVDSICLATDGSVESWDGCCLAAPDEDADWDTPRCAVDWSGFAEALQAARRGI